MKAKHLIKGLVRTIPGVNLLSKLARKDEGNYSNARYHYTIWLRHLVLAYQNGYTTMPRKIAELGPGFSLGLGICALISGAEQYFGLDIIRYSGAEDNLKMFEELVVLFREKTPVPDETEFPRVQPRLTHYEFPEYIFPGNLLSQLLNEERLMKIRKAIEMLDSPDNKQEDNLISYIVPWDSNPPIKEGSLDMILSQSVLQHVDDLALTYKCMGTWLKPNGLQSHEIDFKSMGTSDKWFGHWEYSDIEWKIITTKNAYSINREPHSVHLKLLHDNNFKVIFESKTTTGNRVGEMKLAQKFKNFPAEDYEITSAFIQATRK